MLKLFRKKLDYKQDFVISDNTKLEEIKKMNRRSLSLVERWVSDEDFNESYYNYGVPESIRGLLDLQIGNEITYSDLLGYYSLKLDKRSYLELGVSVGKNFWQFANLFEDSSLTGFDIENLNPVLARSFTLEKVSEWPTMVNSIRKETSVRLSGIFKGNKIGYIAGDIWDERSWATLKGQKFNLIFSDALHDPKALLWEYEMLQKFNLIADDFIIFWDDLNNGLEKSFEDIAIDLKNKRNLSSNHIRLIKINGWLGQNYSIKHDVGIVTNISLE